MNEELGDRNHAAELLQTMSPHMPGGCPRYIHGQPAGRLQSVIYRIPRFSPTGVWPPECPMNFFFAGFQEKYAFKKSSLSILHWVSIVLNVDFLRVG